MASHTVYAVASGKGGVGKTATTVNLGASLAAAGYKVAIVDTDLGMANLGGFIGVEPEQTLHEVLAGDASLEEATYRALNGLAVVPSGISLNGFANVETAALSDAVGALRDAFDYVLLDLGAGLSHDTVLPLALADAVVLVSTPQPVSVQDTAKTREITERLGGRVAGVVLTRAGSPADLSLDEISDTLELPILAVIPEDDAVPASAREGKAVLQHDEDSPTVEGYRGLARIIEAESLEEAPVVPEMPEGDADSAGAESEPDRVAESDPGSDPKSEVDSGPEPEPPDEPGDGAEPTDAPDPDASSAGATESSGEAASASEGQGASASAGQEASEADDPATSESTAGSTSGPADGASESADEATGDAAGAEVATDGAAGQAPDAAATDDRSDDPGADDEGTTADEGTADGEGPADDAETTAAEIAAAIEDAASGTGGPAAEDASADGPSGGVAPEAGPPPDPEPDPESGAVPGSAADADSSDESAAGSDAPGETDAAGVGGAESAEPEAFKVESGEGRGSEEDEAVDQLFSVEGADPDDLEDEEEESSGGLFGRFLG